MEIAKSILRFKFQILIVLIFALTLSAIIVLAPRFVTVLAYFWPLFVSTALFLVAVVVFGRSSASVSDDSSSSSASSSSFRGKPGEELLDYVAGEPEIAVESFKSE